jgi:acylphosphatase
MRWWIRSRALELGLVGWARNLDDGRVEVVAIGREDRCRSLLAQLDSEHPAPGRPGHVVGAVQRWSDAPESAESLPSGFAER